MNHGFQLCTLSPTGVTYFFLKSKSTLPEQQKHVPLLVENLVCVFNFSSSPLCFGLQVLIFVEDEWWGGASKRGGVPEEEGVSIGTSGPQVKILKPHSYCCV